MIVPTHDMTVAISAGGKVILWRMMTRRAKGIAVTSAMMMTGN